MANTPPGSPRFFSAAPGIRLKSVEEIMLMIWNDDVSAATESIKALIVDVCIVDLLRRRGGVELENPSMTTLSFLSLETTWKLKRQTVAVADSVLYRMRRTLNAVKSKTVFVDEPADYIAYIQGLIRAENVECALPPSGEADRMATLAINRLKVDRVAQFTLRLAGNVDGFCDEMRSKVKDFGSVKTIISFYQGYNPVMFMITKYRYQQVVEFAGGAAKLNPCSEELYYKAVEAIRCCFYECGLPFEQAPIGERLTAIIKRVCDAEKPLESAGPAPAPKPLPAPFDAPAPTPQF